MVRKPAISAEQAIAAAGSVIGDRPASAKLVPTVEANVVYALDESCFAKFGPRDRTLKEASAYRAAAAAGVPVPRVLGTGEVGSTTFLVVEAARGVPVSTLDAPLRSRAQREFGEALRVLHTVTATGWGGPDPDRLRTSGEWVALEDVFRPADAARLDYFEQHGLLTTDEVTAVRACLGAVGNVQAYASSLLHSDATSDCAYADPVTGALTALIDFGDCRCGPVVWEFTTFVVRDADALEPVAEGYGLALEEHSAELSAATLVRLLGSARWHHDNDRDKWRERLAIVKHVAAAPDRFDQLWRGGASVP